MACWKVRTEEAGEPRWLAADTAEEVEASPPSAAAGAAEEDRGRRGRRRVQWRGGQKRVEAGGGRAEGAVRCRQAAVGERRGGGGAIIIKFKVGTGWSRGDGGGRRGG